MKQHERERREAVESIVKAMDGHEPDSRDQLAADIVAASHNAANFGAALQVDRAIKKKAAPIIKLMKKAEALAREHPLRATIEPIISRSLGELQAALDCHCQLGPAMSADNRQLTLIDYVAGILLPPIFEARFGSPAKVGGRKREPSGDFINFAMAATEQIMGMTCAPKTIARAFFRLK
jgi:hypothetical protein